METIYLEDQKQKNRNFAISHFFEQKKFFRGKNENSLLTREKFTSICDEFLLNHFWSDATGNSTGD